MLTLLSEPPSKSRIAWMSPPKSVGGRMAPLKKPEYMWSTMLPCSVQTRTLAALWRNVATENAGLAANAKSHAESSAWTGKGFLLIQASLFHTAQCMEQAAVTCRQLSCRGNTASSCLWLQCCRSRFTSQYVELYLLRPWCHDSMLTGDQCGAGEPLATS